MDEIKADLVVVGAGSGGLSVASGAAQLGLRVVLFEAGEMGGDCLNYGCVPSKALIAAAHAARPPLGLGIGATATVNFPAVMAHVRAAMAAIAPHDSQEHFEKIGVRVVRQHASFAGPRVVEGEDIRVRARKIVLATGSRPKIPDVAGLAETPYFTNETIFDLTSCPQRLLIIGGGPIGMELGQAFRRLGAEVAIVQRTQPLPREGRDVVEVVMRQFARDGVEVLAGTQILSAHRGSRGLALRIKTGERTRDIEGSHLLVATGRSPNIEALNLEAGGVAYDRRGVRTDRSLRSISNGAVYAVGDVAGRDAFTHAAGAHASLVIRRALFAMPVNADNLVVPRVTYTDPEVASVGLSEGRARRRYGDRVRTVVARFDDNDRAVTEADQRGFGKLIATRGGKLLGVTIVGRAAGDLIQPWVLAMSASVPLRAMAAQVAPYPTRGEINKRLAGLWFAPSLFSSRTRALVRALKRLA